MLACRNDALKYVEPPCSRFVKISFDISGTLSKQDQKDKFFFGHNDNLQIMWEYCSLSKIDMDISPGLQDEGGKMRVDDHNVLMGFFLIHKTLKVSQEIHVLSWKSSNISLIES